MDKNKVAYKLKNLPPIYCINLDEKVATIMKSGGLCNRIKTMMSALITYEKIYTEVEADAFIFPNVKLVDESINPIIDWRLKVSADEENIIDDYKTIDFLYEKIPQHFINKYLKVIEKLEINSDILDYVNDFIKDWDTDILGVHIRTWYSDYPRNLWHDNSLFEREIDKFPEDKKIFLCSDNPETIKYFSKKYGDRVMTHPQKMHDTFVGQIHLYDQYHNDIQLIVDGFIDCLLLSKCSDIIGTYVSTFTEVAWWFGGCKARVILPKPINYDPSYDDNLFLKK